MRAKSLLLLLTVTSSSALGCSLVFDGGRHVGDGGAMDASAPEDARPGSDGGEPACVDHEDCLISPAGEEGRIVCRPSPGGGFCASECRAQEECNGVAGTGEHPFGTVCVRGQCGCNGDVDCTDPTFSRCVVDLGVCGECVGNADCDPLRTMRFCVFGLCEMTEPCDSPMDCPPELPNCVGPPDGQRRCAPPCTESEPCPPTQTCGSDGVCRAS